MPAFLAQVWSFSSWVATAESNKAVENLVTKNFFSQLAYLKKGDPQFEIFTPQKWGHPTVFEIDSWNFQHMLPFWFREAFQNFWKGDPKFEIFTTQKWGHPTVFEIDSWNFSANPGFRIFWNPTKFQLF